MGGMAVSRMYAFAKYWSRMGHEVTVVTPKKYPLFGAMNYHPPGYENENIRLIEVDFAPWFTKRYERQETSPSDQKVTQKSFLGYVRMWLRGLRKKVIGNSLDVHTIWRYAVEKRAIALLEKEPFDVVFSSFSPQSSHAIASRLKRRYPRLFWLADYRDLWTGNHLLEMHSILKYFQRRKEKRMLAQADMITTVSPGFADYLKALHQKDITVIYNGYDPEEILQIPDEPFFKQDNTFRIVYTGMIYTGTRDPSPLFQAVATLYASTEISPENFEIHFFGDSGDVKEIAHKYGVEHFIHIGGSVPKIDAYRAQRDADMLLLLEHEAMDVDKNLSMVGTIPAKVFEYMASGTPMMVIGLSDKSMAGKLVVRANAGCVCSTDIPSITHYLERCLQEKEKCRSQRDEALIEMYRRDIQAGDLIVQIQKARGSDE